MGRNPGLLWSLSGRTLSKRLLGGRMGVFSAEVLTICGALGASESGSHLPPPSGGLPLLQSSIFYFPVSPHLTLSLPLSTTQPGPLHVVMPVTLVT